MEWLAQTVQLILARWGYLALALGLLGESAGLPLPGETVLMYSSFVAHKTNGLNIFFVILVGSTAAVLGDNIGYWTGRHFGGRLLGWLKREFHMQDDIALATDMLRHHGSATIFWARFIFGLRTVAGPVAGALGMEWKEFLIFNALGAATWVVSMSMLGYLLASEFNSLAGYIEKVSWGISGTVLGVGYFLWRKKKKRYERRKRNLRR